MDLRILKDLEREIVELRILKDLRESAVGSSQSTVEEEPKNPRTPRPGRGMWGTKDGVQVILSLLHPSGYTHPGQQCKSMKRKGLREGHRGSD